jgi:hypothetical protein
MTKRAVGEFRPDDLNARTLDNAKHCGAPFPAVAALREECPSSFGERQGQYRQQALVASRL